MNHNTIYTNANINAKPQNPAVSNDTQRYPEILHMVSGTYRGGFPLVPRDDYQEVFTVFLNENGFDGYGYYEGKNDLKNKTMANARGGFENNTFAVNPYYWGDDEDEIAKPNFIYKPGNIEIRWYKYPMRDSYCSKQITPEVMKEILHECKKSMIDAGNETNREV